MEYGSCDTVRLYATFNIQASTKLVCCICMHACDEQTTGGERFSNTYVDQKF
jgi:hypothetical protein